MWPLEAEEGEEGPRQEWARIRVAERDPCGGEEEGYT